MAESGLLSTQGTELGSVNQSTEVQYGDIGTADAVVTDLPAVEVEVQARSSQDLSGMQSLTAVMSEVQGSQETPTSTYHQGNLYLYKGDNQTFSEGLTSESQICNISEQNIVSSTQANSQESVDQTSLSSFITDSVVPTISDTNVTSLAAQFDPSNQIINTPPSHQIANRSPEDSANVPDSQPDSASCVSVNKTSSDQDISTFVQSSVSTPNITSLSQAELLESVQLKGKKESMAINGVKTKNKSPSKHSLWCEDCGRVNAGTCKKHGGLTSIPDCFVPSFARLTLPPVLTIKQDSAGEGVFAKKYIKGRSQFGPLQAPFCSAGTVQKKEFYFMGYNETETLSQYELEDEDRCNWMMFVRPALNNTDQNLVAYLYNGKVFFTTTKPIEYGRELRVWYSSDYAVTVGWSPLVTDSSDQEVVVKRGETSGDPECEEQPAVSEDVDGGAHDGDADDVDNADADADPEEMDVEKDQEFRIVENEVSEDEDYCFCVLCATQFKTREELDQHNCKKTITKGSHRGATKRKGSPRKLTLDDDWSPPNKKKGERAKKNKRKPGRKPKEKIKAGKVKVIRNEVPDTPRKKYQRTPKFSCAYCPEVFTSQDPYRVHEASHTGKSAYVCDVEGCGKGFDTKFTHWRHMLVHDKPRNKQCPYCEKTFNRRDHLKTHLKVHDQQRFSFLCDKCGKSYLHKSTYDYHIALHEAKEGVSLVCLICSEEFPTKNDLITHTLSHNRYKSLSDQQRKHPCPQCHRMFYTKKDVKRHMIVHTKEKTFLCELCPQTFGRKDHLQRHYKTNHSKEPKKEKSDDIEMPFSCDLCEQKFAKKKLLSNHKKFCPEQTIQAAIVTIQEHPLQQAAGEITEASVTSSSYNLYTLSNPPINPPNTAAKALEHYIATNVSSACSVLNTPSSVMDTSAPVTYINGQTLNVLPQIREQTQEQLQQGKERVVYQDQMVSPRQNRQLPWTFVVEERDDHSYSTAAAPVWSPKVPNFRPTVSTAAEIETARLLQSAQSTHGTYPPQNNTTTMAVAWDTMTEYFAVQPCSNLSSITEVVTSPNIVPQQPQQISNQNLPQQQRSLLQQNSSHH